MIHHGASILRPSSVHSLHFTRQRRYHVKRDHETNEGYHVFNQPLGSGTRAVAGEIIRILDTTKFVVKKGSSYVKGWSR